ncbi:sulfite exporter TauE/SafE family protein [Myceligenerans pegani]|uniref:Probable membrane transporter protein n=1 Tax=Myceligenerans pegani TaxID=2776917 RepID=A0ABR9N3U9_9MICO|nr:sulfite exporter TauE/SafE family protein [Myceligenerans sp. TRM 65318]MBE1878342.1 sulfite exporter TauE/SafE family protein [Myceligenerans sp. TRM 65318]MBE3020613.1 sulfite exporter TauE/SafE family protein [Myceligenerans sp. TRM 65318]
MAEPDGIFLLVMLFALILVSGVVQSLSGFGFALFSAPLLTATIGGPQAVSTILITGTACDIAILAMRRSVPRPDVREAVTLAGWSAPGMLAGAWLLAALPSAGLQVFVAGVVVAAVLLRLRTRERPVVISTRWAVPTGVLSGALGTSTSLAGPPVVYYLVHRGLRPHTMRDTLVALSLVRLPLSVVSLLVAGVWETYQYWPVLVVAALAGQYLGTRAFHRFGHTRYEHIVLGLLTLAAVVSVASLALP